jgi:hypothetical protein
MTLAVSARSGTLGDELAEDALVAFARETNTSPRARTMSDWIWAASLSDLPKQACRCRRKTLPRLVERLLDVAADLGGLGNQPATAVSMAAVTFSEPACMSAARTLAVSACFFTNSRAASGTSRFWSLVNASVTGAKASLTVFSTELVSVVIGASPSSGLSYGLTPSGLARGTAYVP